MRQVILGLFFISFTAIVSILAFRYAIADYYFEQAKITFGETRREKLAESKDFKQYFNLVDKALAWRPNHVDALDFKGDLFYQSWLLWPDGKVLSDSKLLKQAISYHTKALQLRPNWVFSHARLALIYSHQTKLGSQFDYWYTQSHRLGVYETQVAKSLSLVGLKNWDRLSPSQRGLTLGFIGATIEKKSTQIKWIIEVLKFYDKYDYVCSRLKNTFRKNLVCQVI